MKQNKWNKESQQAKIDEITKELEDGVKSIFESDNYKKYLEFMSRFHTYSLNNTILIMQQNPNATLVSSYDNWKRQGRYVKKDEHGLSIFVPVKKKVTVDIPLFDPHTKKPVCDSQGNQLYTKMEQTKLTFKIGKVFDISQTDGKEIPSFGLNELNKDVDNYTELISVLQQNAAVPIEFQDEMPVLGIKGYYSHTEKKIGIKTGMSELQTLKTLIHEYAHSMLHSANIENYSREVKEVQAESVAFTVCNYLGLDTSEYSFGYIASWSQGKQIKELKESLQVIKDASAKIISYYNEHSLAMVHQQT